jgi:hypothetical protein
MDGLHWPGYGIGFDFSVVEVVLEIPALFEDILMIPVVWANLTETQLLLVEASLRSFDAPRAKRVVVILSENGTHWKGECRWLE